MRISCYCVSVCVGATGEGWGGITLMEVIFILTQNLYFCLFQEGKNLQLFFS